MNQERRREDEANGVSPRTREVWKNIETKTIDMRKMSSTDLPFNSRVYLPEGLDESIEVEMHQLKEKLKATVSEYVKTKEFNS